MSLAEIERQKYLRAYGTGKYHLHSPHGRCWDRIRDEISHFTLYANFGCGSGLLDEKIAGISPEIRGILVDHVDFLLPAVRENPNFEFIEASLFGQMPSFLVPYAVSTDVMEHIPTEMVDTVLANIVDRSERAFFQISLDPTSERKAAKYGGHLHLTVKEPDWWLARLRKHFSKVVTPQMVTHPSKLKKGWLAVTAHR